MSNKCSICEKSFYELFPMFVMAVTDKIAALEKMLFDDTEELKICAKPWSEIGKFF